MQINADTAIDQHRGASVICGKTINSSENLSVFQQRLWVAHAMIWPTLMPPLVRALAKQRYRAKLRVQSGDR
jgi:hypothetical protein